MIISVREAGGIGLIADKEGYTLPINAWTRGENVRMVAKCVETFSGNDQVFGTPSVAPGFIYNITDGIAQNWVYANTSAVHVYRGGTHYDITQVGGYSAGSAEDWVASQLGGVLLLTNGVDDPQMWGLNTGVPCADLANWPASTQAKLIESFRNFIFVGDVTESGVRYPRTIRWSSQADPGTVPTSWDYADPTNLAGRKELADTEGYLQQLVTLDEFLMIYKEDSIYRYRLIGGQDIFQERSIATQIGVFGKRCVAEFNDPVMHFVFGFDDCVVHNGQNPTSVMEERLRKWLYARVSTDYFGSSFVVVNAKEHEVWVCFPEQGATYCNLAAVWNWGRDVWSIRELPDVSHGAGGTLDPNAVATKWSDWSATPWDSIGKRWSARAYNPLLRRLALCSASNNKIYRMDEGTSFTDGAGHSLLERTGLAFSLDAEGHPFPERETVKLVKEIWPRVTGQGTINIYVGGSDEPEGAISWQGPLPFVIGQDIKVNPYISKRFPAIRFESDSPTRWTMEGFDIVQDMVGMGGW